jgi:hypothetical protein
MEDKSIDGDSSSATPRTSNKRVVSIEDPQATSTALPSIREGSPPLQNPLHNTNSEESLFGTHFQANEGGDSDSRPVAPTRKASANSLESDSGKIRTLEREMNFQDEESGRGEDGDSVSSSYVGDVDERTSEEDIQFQPEGYLSVETFQPKPGGFNISSSVHTEATSTMSASGATNTSMATPDRPAFKKEINFSPGGSNIEGPSVPKKGSFVGNLQDGINAFSETETMAVQNSGFSDTSLLDMEADLDDILANDGAFVTGSNKVTASTPENPLSDSNIPGESFLKMGSLMQSQLVESGEQGTGFHESTVAEDDHDKFLDEILDDNLIVAGEKARPTPDPFQNSKDEHDDLLESAQEDDGDDAMKDRHQHLVDDDDALLDSMLGEDDVLEQDPMQQGDEKRDEYVPDESIRKLEALLDEGLAGHGSINADGAEDEGVSHTLEVDQHDTMALELDALLDGVLEEEVQFDVEIPPSVALTEETTELTCESKTKNAPPSNAKSRTAAARSVKLKMTSPAKVRSFFKSRTSTERNDVKDATRNVNKKKSLFGSKAAQRASDSLRKSITPRTRRVPKQIAKNPASRQMVSPLKGPKSSPTRFTSMKRFMSPTFASRRRNNEANEDSASPCDENLGSTLHSTPKASWRASGRSFLSSTLSSLKKIRSASPDREEKCRMEGRRSGDVIKDDGTKVRLSGAFMEPTFAKTMLETETRILVERKALEREEEAKKIVVKLSWEEDAKPSPLIDYSKSLLHSQRKMQMPIQANGDMSTPSWKRKSRLIWNPKSLAPGDTRSEAKEDESVTPMKHTPESVFSPRSLGSLSSMCSIHSFVSPKKAGIRGCQSKYNQTLHKFRAPCELCIFRLSDGEKAELDAHGRHFMVQFTSGGCPDCEAFPTSFDEPPVRLCVKCFADSHRPEKKRMRKKGNDAAIKGYSFAKTDYV